MAERKRVTHDMEIIIGKVVADNGDASLKDIVRLANQALKPCGPLVPASETVRKHVMRHRNGLNKVEDKQLDSTWSIGTGATPDIPNDGLPNVIAVWKFCLATEKEFTVRHARWVSRLAGLVRDRRMLYYWAHQYVLLERVGLALGEPVGALDPDAALVMHPWEYATACYLNLVSPSLIPGEFSVLSGKPWEEFDELCEEAIFEAETDALSEAVREPGKGLFMGGEKIAPDMEDWTTEARWVYVYWLRNIQKGPKWLKLSAHKKATLIAQLTEWISSRQQQALKWGMMDMPLEKLMLLRHSGQQKAPLRELLPSMLIPTEIIRQAGYGEITSKRRESYERTHKTEE